LQPTNARKSSERIDTRTNSQINFDMQEHKPLLPEIRSPLDLKKLNALELNRLAGELRDLIVATVSRNGGHLASNLGVVELTIALHYVYNSPFDSIIWDVGHQCYAHKILTGRSHVFSSLRLAGGIAGFPKFTESPHDGFNTGHASTSISAALGILAAEKILESGRRAAAVIGDGALTGGLAYEALSHAGQLELPLVVILNDNNMSIGPNVGGLSKYLSRLSMKARYQKFRRAVDAFVKKIPLAGGLLFNVMVRLKRAVKAVFYTDNFFVDLGFEYVGPIDGHHILQLIQVIKDAGNLNKPVVIHVITQKGKGYSFAESNPKTYHGVPAFQVEKTLESGNDQITFTQVFGKTLLEAGKQDKAIVAITAAMEEGTGLSPFKEAFPGRFFDAGIAEEHAVTFAAGFAARGLRPVTAIYSTFIQRALDQVIHDVCLQNLPVIFALDRSGLVSDDGETHQGIFDISLFRSAPNLTILAPAGEEELVQMLQWALTQPSPVMIRYPKAPCPSGDGAFVLPVERGKGCWIRRNGAKVLILFTGSLYSNVLEAASILAAYEINTDIYNLRFIKPVDEDYLASVLNQYEIAVIAEEGVIPGGFGEYASELAVRRNCPSKIKILGIKEKFDALGKRAELLKRNGLDGAGIADAVASVAGKETAKESGRTFI
jgi:1-deoxy-D-xylulose-5-phosphate synthase